MYKEYAKSSTRNNGIMKENFTKANQYPNRASLDNRGEECGKRGERLCGRE
jgi:hypothetical protein